MFTFQIVSRMGTRSVSYSKRSVLAALTGLGLTWTERSKMVLEVRVGSLQARKDLEYALQLIDKGVAYRVIKDPEDSPK